MKIFLRIVLILNMLFIGFCGAAFFSARFIVAKEEGLAGSASVLVYGIFGALIVTLIALIITRNASSVRLRNVVIGAVIVSAITIGVLVIRINSL